MNSNYSNNSFKYSNQQYTVLVNMFTNTGDKDKDLHISFDATDIEEIIYENKLNDLLIKGHIIYTDRYAAVDKFLNSQYCYCELMFTQNSKKQDNDIGSGQIEKEKTFCHNFIVSNIKIIARTYSLIKYQIDIISMNWFKCAANISYSNYGKPPEQIFQIIKACLTNNNLAIDEDSFDKIKAPVTLKYITKTNDNVFSSVNYLLHKLYYLSNMKDDSLKFLVYDWFEDKYRLLDLRDKYSTIGTYATTLSFFKTNLENLIQQEPTNIGSFLSPCTKTKLYSDIFSKHMYSYDYNYDKLVDGVVKSEDIVNYMNSKIDSDGYDKKYEKMFTFPNMKHEYYGSYWENNFDVYNESVAALEENNSLILNITGNIRRQPGSMNIIAIDRGLANSISDNKKEIEKLKIKYKAYEGTWIASKVRNIISPQRSQFRQQVALFRNFIPKIVSTS